MAADAGSANLVRMDAQQTRQADPPVETVSAWQCIGCGRIEAPQTCIGVCQDRRVEFVYAVEHAQSRAELEVTRHERDALRALVRTLAFSRPRDGEWERSYRALQGQARALMLCAAPGTRRFNVAA
jgi:hypothetical protein